MIRFFGEVFDFAVWLAGCVAAAVLVGVGFGLFLQQSLVGGDISAVVLRALHVWGLS